MRFVEDKYSGTNVTIDAGDGDDTISNGASNVTIDAGDGDDSISLSGSYGGMTSTGNVIVYNEGDGSDTITGFDATSTLQIVGTYYTQESGSDIIVTVGDGSVLLKGAASLSAVNITGEDEIPAPSDQTITDGVASYKTLFTITGLKAGVTVDEIEDNVSIGGATVTVNENVLGDDEVTISDGYTLALARTVELSEEFSATWNVNGTTATYTGEYVTAGYAVVDGTIIHRDATDGKTFTLTGIKRNLTESALNENVEISDTTVTLNENVLDNTTVAISDGFTLALADTVEQSETVSANWDINSTGDTSTAIYISGGTTAGYALDDNKIIYNNSTGGTFTLTGLSKTFSADDVSIDGNKITLTPNALAQTNVTLTTTDGRQNSVDGQRRRRRLERRRPQRQSHGQRQDVDGHARSCRRKFQRRCRLQSCLQRRRLRQLDVHGHGGQRHNRSQRQRSANFARRGQRYCHVERRRRKHLHVRRERRQGRCQRLQFRRRN